MGSDRTHVVRYPNHFNMRRRWVWHDWPARLGRFLRADWLFIELAVILGALLSCGNVDTAGAQPAGSNVSVYVDKALRPILDSAFARFETTPDAPRIVCVNDAHVLLSEKEPGKVAVLLFAAGVGNEHCGTRPVLFFDLRCRNAAVDARKLAEVGVPWMAFLCRQANGQLWISLIMADSGESRT